MAQTSYLERRGQIEAYFDRTAADAWARLTSDAPVSGVRATVREGRETMRRLLVDWVSNPVPAAQRGALPLASRRLLDAGCGTGLLAVDCARLGAHVTAIDLSPTLVDLARERLPGDLSPGSVRLLAGDMRGTPRRRSLNRVEPAMNSRNTTMVHRVHRISAAMATGQNCL